MWPEGHSLPTTAPNQSPGELCHVLTGVFILEAER